MKKIKLIRTLSCLLLAGVLLVEAVALALVWRLNMLPSEYLVLLAAFLLVLWVTLSALLLLPGRKKKLPGTGRIVAVAILTLVVLCGCGFASKIAADVYETMNHISAPTQVAAYMEIYVRTEDPAQSVADAADYTFAITDKYDMENTHKAIEMLEADLGVTIATQTYADVYAMTDALYAQQVDAMLINAAYISIMMEVEGYTDFSSRARLLGQIDIMETSQSDDGHKNLFDWLISGNKTPDSTEPGADTQPGASKWSVDVPAGDITKVPFVVYLGGADSRKEGLATFSKNDVNILAVVNPVTKQVLLINTPRDYYVPNPAGNGALDKLTHCGAQSVENSVAALSQFYQVPIRFYGQVGFDGIRELVDAVDGVTVYSEVSYEAMGVWIQQGENHLDGEQALAFARERKNIAGGDNARGKNQMKIIKALIKKMASGKIVSNYTEILSSLRGMFRTNMTAEEMAALVKMQLSDLASWNVVSYSVTGESAERETYSMPGYTHLFVYLPNMDTVEYARELMQRVVDGEVINQEDIIPAK